MWRKPDGKASSDAADAPSPMPARTQFQNTVQPKPASFEAAPTVASTPVTAAFAPRSAPEPVSPGASRIGAGLKIRGEISGNADLNLDGEVNGKVRVTGARVTVGSTGKVQADIEAREIVVNGSVEGNLKAEARVRLGSASQVEGALTAPSIGIDDGARFRGKVEVIRSKPSGAAPKPELGSSEAESLNPVGANVEAE
jgi:cytoskeletal protein CcmA (bactofilin family)